MDIDKTIIAFQCCIQTPTDCAKCPTGGPGFGIVCRQMVKDSVICWLEFAKESVRNWEQMNGQPTMEEDKNE